MNQYETCYILALPPCCKMEYGIFSILTVVSGTCIHNNIKIIIFVNPKDLLKTGVTVKELLGKQLSLTCFISLGFTASFLALSSQVPRRKLSSEPSNTSISFIS